MHGMVAWFVKNPVAANLLMITIIISGVYSLYKKIPLEVFPAFESGIITITVAYSGATPSETEQGIVIPIENAISNLTGIKKIRAKAMDGMAQLNVEVEDGYDTNQLLNEIKSRVEGISTLPEDADRPLVESLTFLHNVITVIVSMSGDDEKQLRKTTEIIRDELRHLPNITHVAMGGIRPWEINIIIPRNVLEQYDLTLDRIATSIRNSSRDIPGGSITTASGEIHVRALGQAYRKSEFANITVLSHRNGSQIKLGDIATIIDGFNDDPLYSLFDNTPSAFINVSRVGDQNAIELAETVKAYIAEKNNHLPTGITLNYWRDGSTIVKARLKTLTNSATQGILLVFILLALFLRPIIAFWVGIGIPICFLGAFMLMPELGVSLNIISMFAFIVVLGIVVDDAIVTSENVYSHLRRHGDSMRAAIEGTQEISVPVTFGVLTTVAAFIPLLLLEGVRAPIFAQIPLIVIPVLLFSLVESKMILPVHLSHIKRHKNSDLNWFSRLQQGIANGLERYVDKVHRPFLAFTLHWRYATLALFIALLILSLTIVVSGRYKFVFFPRVSSEYVSATLKMPEGTPIEITSQHIQRIYQLAETLKHTYKEPTGESIIHHILLTVGSASPRPSGKETGKSHLARVSFEMIPPETRKNPLSTPALVNEWKQLIGTIPGAKELSFRAEIGRGGEPIDIQLTGQQFEKLNQLGELIKEKLSHYEGLFDIKNSYESGKTEIQLRIKPEAEQLGLTLSTLGKQIRYALSGIEAQRIQRNQSDVKVMVRYPKEERYSLTDLENLKIRTPQGAYIPLPDLAEIHISKGTNLISRVDRQRIINITADMDKEKGNANAISAEMNEWIAEQLTHFPDIHFNPEGEQLEQKKFGESMRNGFIIALMLIYVLLAIPLRSYLQPFMVMIVIPFSFIGVLIGHMMMGFSLSISSFMGLLALVGVVVNDSLVLVDYINKKVLAGMPLLQAVKEAGSARFRPILLTSLTTFAGLTPLIFEKSTQAQFLIPMAISLGFGIIFSTLLTLLLIPSLYLILDDLRYINRLIKKGLKQLLYALWLGFVDAIGFSTSKPREPISPSSDTLKQTKKHNLKNKIE